MVKKDISANFHQKCLILCSKILINVLHNLNLNSSVTMATYWVPDLPIIRGVSGHLWRSIFILNVHGITFRLDQAIKSPFCFQLTRALFAPKNSEFKIDLNIAMFALSWESMGCFVGNFLVDRMKGFK